MKKHFKNLDYLSVDTDRHGNKRVYVRRNGQRRRIRETPGTPAFLLAVEAALASLDLPHEHAQVRGRAIVPGSLAALAVKLFASKEFQRLDAKSQTDRRSVIEECLREKSPADNNLVIGDMPAKVFSGGHMRYLMEKKEAEGLPGGANNRRKWLSTMFTWGLQQEPPLVTRNPTRDVPKLKVGGDGFYTWTDEDIAAYEKRHAIGTKARLALGLVIFTGLRLSDTVRVGPPHVRNGVIAITPEKTDDVRPELTHKPLLPELDEIIKAMPVIGSKTYLVTECGLPFSKKGFGNWFKDRCVEAGLPQCSLHGLRKAAAVRCADAGATVHDMMQLFDWSSPQMAVLYIKRADKKRAAARTILHLSRRQPTPV